MDFRELTYITAVADAASVTEAARRLYISQPSLSYIIAKVEEDLGVKLFDRKTNPLSLTYAGEKYVQTARDILRMRDNMRREMNDIGHGAKGRINIGIPNERAGYMLPKAIPVFYRKYPGVEIRLEESQSEEIIRNLMIDKIGFCILPGNEEDLPPGVLKEFIYKEKIYLVAGEGMIPPEMILSPGARTIRVGHADPALQSGDRFTDPVDVGSAEARNISEDSVPNPDFTLVDLKKMPKTMPFIMQKRNQFIRKKTDDIFRRLGFFPKEIMEISSSITAVQLAEAGMGLTIVPERTIHALGGFDKIHCYLYGPEPDSWDVNVVYKKDTYLDSAERAFIDAMKEVFGR